MKYRLEDLVDIPKLQELTDHLYDAAGIPSAIITMDGEILTGSGWQRICTDFHRKHPDIEKECIESDIAIRKKMGEGEPFTMYTCPRGLTDASVPIIIEGEHIANAFAGQLFLEEPGEDTEQFFREQARQFGMDEEAYIEAFREVPVVPVEKFRAMLSFLEKLANTVANLGLQRKRELEAQESLRQSEQKYRTLFENMTQGVFYQRADGSLVDCNSALLELFGLTRDEFFGRTSMHPEWRVLDEDGSLLSGDRHPSMRALQTGEPVRDAVIGVFNPRRQEYVWVMVNAIPQFQPGEDQPYQVFVTLHDITERNRAQLELRQFEWLLEKEGRQVEEVSRVFAPAYTDPTKLNTARVILDGVGTEALDAMSRDMLDLLDTCVAVYEANGDYAYGVFDSTWCQTMDDASFRLCGTDDTREALACGKWLCHENCWNDSAKAAMMTGEPTDIECVGGIRLYAVPIRAGDEIIGALNIGYSTPPRNDNELLELSEKYQVDFERLRGNSMAYKPRPPFIIDVAKRRCHSMAKMIGHTIEGKRAEEEKEKLEQQLYHSQKMESIGRLAGGVAHDFNNLLTGITGNVQLAQLDMNLGDPLFETLDDVNEAAKRAAELTHQLLAFSRKQIIEPRVINLNDLIRDLHKMLVRIIGEDLELKTIPQTDLGFIKADPGQIEQVIINLSINARDAMPDGGKLTIETADVSLDEVYCKSNPNVQPGDHIMLAVSDNGTGMDDETRKNIFDPFYTTKEEGQGTGLGLAMVYGIVKQHGGSINVYSEVGEGTTFKIYFPLAKEQAVPAEKKRKVPALPHGKETILVVEDAPMVRDIAIKILDRLGYEVISAKDGPGALAIIEKMTTPVDLLLTDVIMPNMNGRELAQRVQRLHPEMKVLYTSGYTENVIAHHGVLDEGLDFLGKPYNPQSLAAKVRKLLDEK